MLLEKQLQYNKVYKIPLTINQCTLLLGLFFPQLLISTLTVRFDRNYFILAPGDDKQVCRLAHGVAQHMKWDYVTEMTKVTVLW